MKEFYADKIQSEEGAETVEIIIGIVVFVIFGLTVFGMITKAAGTKAADISNCFADSGSIINKNTTSADTSTTCLSHDDSSSHTYHYNNTGK
jgi:hypothetical protein